MSKNYMKHKLVNIAINIVWRKKYENQKIIGLDKAYKEIFSSKNLHINLNKINGEYKDNELVNEVISFIEKDKKRPICSPQS